MNTEDIVQILKQHRGIEEVVLEKSKDLKEVWENFIYAVYHNALIEKMFWDEKLRDQLLDFELCDSLEIVTKKGRVLKRFAFFYKTQTGEGIPDNIMGILGDLLQSLITKENSLKFFLDFTNNFDWNDGDFGKSGSCWWGTYSDSLPTFEQGGGWCVRFYNENHDGIGRTWLYPDPECGVLLGFNSYGVERGKVSKSIKRIFAQHNIELHYSRCNIENSNSSSIPYINGGTGFVLYTDDISPEKEYDLDMEVIEDENHETCDGCGCRINTDDGEYNSVGDYIYCQSCTDDKLSFCDKCQEFCDKDDVYSVGDKHSRFDCLCEYCAQSVGMVLCSSCGEYSEYVFEAYDSGNCFCESCNELFFCEKCENYFENSNECPDCDEDEEEETAQDTNLKHESHLWDGLEIGTEKIDFLGKIKEVRVYRFPDIPGLLVCKNNNWMVYHINSKLGAMVDIRSFDYAIEAMKKFGELANWSELSQEDILHNSELCEKSRKIQFYIRRNQEV